MILINYRELQKWLSAELSLDHRSLSQDIKIDRDEPNKMFIISCHNILSAPYRVDVAHIYDNPRNGYCVTFGHPECLNDECFELVRQFSRQSQQEKLGQEELQDE